MSPASPPPEPIPAGPPPSPCGFQNKPQAKKEEPGILAPPFPSRRKPPALLASLLLFLTLLLFAPVSHALPLKLGDLDEDGVPTILDIAKLAGHFQGTHPLSPALALFADVNQDGALNEADQEALANDVLQLTAPRDLPLAAIREVSPALGEADVAVTRETIIHFTLPLATQTSIDTTRFRAEFGGRKILSRVDLAADRKQATLFYLEPLPSNARVIVTFDGTGLTDLIDRPIDADGDGQPGGIFTTEFETISTQPVPETGVTGFVYASERGTGGGEVPLAGVIITVDGAEESLRAVTAADGSFTLNPCPSGTFFVHIDGRTSPASSYPAGDYYPSVGKKWFATPGRGNNPAGDLDDTPNGGGTGVIYLPLVRVGTLTTVSPVQETVITFPPSVLAAHPRLAGTEIRIPANSLFADDGTRGGMVGIAPVAPDRIPSPLPPGLNPPLVFTVQSDGATNFDQPVPVCLPNLPDPATGIKLEPGDKSALFSFNHDIGEWEIAGSMTVSEDGTCVRTDAGVGIRQPGWHVSQPGCEIRGVLKSTDCNFPKELDAFMGSYGSSIANVLVYYDSADNFVRNVKPPAVGWGWLLGLVNSADTCMKALGSSEPWTTGKVANCLAVGVGIALAVAIAAEAAAAIAILEGVSLTLSIFTAFDSIADLYDKSLQAEQSPGWECPIPLNEISAFQKELQALSGNLQSSAASVSRLRALAEVTQNTLPVITDAMRQSDPSMVYTLEQQRAISNSLMTLAQFLGGLNSLDTTAQQSRDQLQKVSAAYKQLGSKLAELDVNDTTSIFMKVSFGGVTSRSATSKSFRIIVPADATVDFSFTSTPTLKVAATTVVSGGSGTITDAGVMWLRKPKLDLLDLDDDGIIDSIERIIGTDPTRGDTDRNGIGDLQGLLTGGLASIGAARTGVTAQTKVANAATDISSSSRTLAVACGSEGTAFLATQGIAAPVMRTRIPTPNWAAAVSVGANAALIAESGAGFRCVSLDDRLNVTAMTLWPIAGRADSAVAVGGIGYGGTSNGTIVELDLASGGILRQLETGAGGVEDLAVQGDWLFARKPDRLLAIQLSGVPMTVAGQLVLSTGTTPSAGRLRIALAEGRIFCTRVNGVQIVDITSLPVMTLAGTVTGPGDNWRHFQPNGNVGLLAGKVQVTNNWLVRLPIPLSLFVIPPAGNTANIGPSFTMPGFAKAVALNRGIGYVACDNGSLAVVNYLDFDRQRQAPGIVLSSSVNLALPAPEVIEGSVMRLSASVTDDVQVGNVEFFVDGVLAFDDGAYPFEHRFLAPRRSLTRTTFKVRARAVDTGGNAAWSQEYEIRMLPDATPPVVRSFVPAHGTMNRTVANVFVRFNELMDPLTLTTTALSLTEAGADGAFATADDAAVPFVPFYSDGDTPLRLAPTAPLPPGVYRVSAGPPAADATGNLMASAAESIFRVYSLIDTDNDGLPDDWETVIGTNSAVGDSDGNGIADGVEDRDNDGTPDGAEVFRLAQDPRLADANGNGIIDGNDDSDSDGLRDGLEAIAGTDFLRPDTDGDGLDDGTEYAAGMNPLDSSSILVLSTQSASVSLINAEREITPLLPTAVQSGPTSFKNNSP